MKGLLNYVRVFVVFFLRRGLETTGDSFLMLPNEGPARSQQVMFSNCRRLMYVTCMEGTKKEVSNISHDLPKSDQKRRDAAGITRRSFPP